MIATASFNPIGRAAEPRSSRPRGVDSLCSDDATAATLETEAAVITGSKFSALGATNLQPRRQSTTPGRSDQPTVQRFIRSGRRLVRHRLVRLAAVSG